MFFFASQHGRIDTWKNTGEKSLFWGLPVWLIYRMFQDCFIYNTLLGEPFFPNVFERNILMLRSLAEGIVIGFFLARKSLSDERQINIAPDNAFNKYLQERRIAFCTGYRRRSVGMQYPDKRRS